MYLHVYIFVSPEGDRLDVGTMSLVIVTVVDFEQFLHQRVDLYDLVSDVKLRKLH